MGSSPLTNDEKRIILRNYGRVPGTETAARLGRSTSAVYSCVRRFRRANSSAKTADNAKQRGNVVMVRDPSGTFTPGARFNKLDLSHGVRNGTWACGTQFRIHSRGYIYEALVVGKTLIRLDTLEMLEVNTSGIGTWVPQPNWAEMEVAT